MVELWLGAKIDFQTGSLSVKRLHQNWSHGVVVSRAGKAYKGHRNRHDFLQALVRTKRLRVGTPTADKEKL